MRLEDLLEACLIAKYLQSETQGRFLGMMPIVASMEVSSTMCCCCIPFCITTHLLATSLSVLFFSSLILSRFYDHCSVATYQFTIYYYLFAAIF